MIATKRQSICSECKKSLSEHGGNPDHCPYCGAPVNDAADGRGFASGTTGYCFSGRGWIVVPLGIALPVVAMSASIVYLYDCFVLPSAILIPLGSGWILAGATCWILGRVWNRDRALHRYLGFRVESWGLFYFVSGVLILLPILLLNPDTMTTREPGAFGVVCGVILGLAAIGCILLQLATLLIGSAFLLVWVPVYVVKMVMSFKVQLTQARIRHEHC